MASLAIPFSFSPSMQQRIGPPARDYENPCARRPEWDRQSFETLAVHLDARLKTYWCNMRPPGRPSFTPALLADLAAMQGSLRRLCAEDDAADPSIRYFVLGSETPGIFNLGGDLALFGALIQTGDLHHLRAYARSCIDVIHENAITYDLPIVTIAMVQGDALGGGFEAALSCNLIVAERSAKFGFPEILFNLFPGMGAYSFLARRIGAVAAEKMLVSGRLFDASELKDMGIVDMVVEDGGGPEAVRAYIHRNTKRHNGEQGIYRVRQRVNPVDHAELRDIADLWAEAALRLNAVDLRKMQRITMAQNRRITMAPSLGRATGVPADGQSGGRA